MFNLVVMFCFGYEVVAEIINGSISDWDSGNKVSISESTYITSDVSSSSDSLGIICILERLNLPGETGLVCSTKVFRKGFGSTSERDPRLGVGHSDKSDISEVVPILAYLLLATNLAFFYNICSRLSTGCTNLACCRSLTTPSSSF